MNITKEFLLSSAGNPIIFFIVVALVSSAVVVLGRRLVRRNVEDLDLRYRASKLVGAVAFFIAALVIIFRFSGQFTGLTVALGAFSAGVAFALQEVIASLAGWVGIAMGGFYKVGDRIQLGGIKGDVIDIGLIRTTLMETGEWVHGDLYNGRIVRIANSYVFKEPVFNYSGDFPFIWDEILIPIKYGSDRNFTRALLEKAANDELGNYIADAEQRWAELVRMYRIEPARIAPLVTLTANDNWIEFTIRYVVGYQARRITKDKLFSRILDDIDAAADKVSIASATFHLVEAPSIQIKMID